MKASLTLIVFLTIIADCFSQSFFDKDLSFGYGINSATGVEKSQALIYENGEDELISSDLGQTISLQSVRVTSLNELIKELRTSLSISGKGSYGAFSASATYKKELFRRLTLTNYSQYLLLKVFVINPDKKIKTPKLTKEAKDLAQRNRDAFLNQYGDEFVYRKLYGGDLYILFEFNSKTKTEYEKATSAISATGSYFSAGGSASYKKEAVKSLLDQVTDKRVWILKEGGLTALPNIDIDSLDKFARVTFGVDILRNPKVIGVETKPFSDQFFTETQNVNFQKIRTDQKNTLDQIFERTNYIQQNITNAQYVLDNIELFDIDSIKNYFYKYSASEFILNKANGDYDYLESIKKYIETGKRLNTLLQDLLSACGNGFENCQNYNPADFHFIEFIPPPKITFTRNKLIETTDVNMEVKVDDGFYLNYKPVYSPFGYCDWYTIKYISVRGSLSHKTTSIDMYNGRYIVIEFLDDSKNIIKSLPVQSGEDIKWIPGTYARIKFQYAPDGQIENGEMKYPWKSYKRRDITTKQLYVVTF